MKSPILRARSGFRTRRCGIFRHTRTVRREVMKAGDPIQVDVDIINVANTSLKVANFRATLHLPHDHRLIIQNFTLQPRSYDLVGHVVFEWDVKIYWNVFHNALCQVMLKMNSGRVTALIDRLYTLSSWVSFLLETGFHITQLHEPYIDPKVILADALDYMKFVVGKPTGMCWECTKPLTHGSM